MHHLFSFQQHSLQLTHYSFEIFYHCFPRKVLMPTIQTNDTKSIDYFFIFMKPYETNFLEVLVDNFIILFLRIIIFIRRILEFHIKKFIGDNCCIFTFRYKSFNFPNLVHYQLSSFDEAEELTLSFTTMQIKLSEQNDNFQVISLPCHVLCN